MEHVKQPFTNGQIEILKLFADNLTDIELADLKKMLAAFRFRRATLAADKVWEEKGWTEKDAKAMLNIHERTPYRSYLENAKKKK